MTHKHGFGAQLIQKEGRLSFLRAEMIHVLPGSTLTVKYTEAGQLGMLAPMTLTPTGVVPQAGGGTADYWYWNNQLYLVRHHTHSTSDPYSCLGAIAQCHKQN